MEYAIICFAATEHRTGTVYWPPEAERVGLAEREAAAALAAAEKESRAYDPDSLDTFAIAKVIKKFPSTGFGNYADVRCVDPVSGEEWEEQVQYPFPVPA